MQDRRRRLKPNRLAHSLDQGTHLGADDRSASQGDDLLLLTANAFQGCPLSLAEGIFPLVTEEFHDRFSSLLLNQFIQIDKCPSKPAREDSPGRALAGTAIADQKNIHARCP